MIDIHIKFNEGDLEALKNAAKCANVTLSEFVRVAALTKAKKVLLSISKEKEGEKENLPPTPPIREKEKEKEEERETRARTGKRFVPPTLEEVKAYVAEKRYTFSPEAFFDFYSQNNWMVGKYKMRIWRLACATWQHKREEDVKSRMQWRTSRLERERALMELPVDEIAAKKFREFLEKGDK